MPDALAVASRRDERRDAREEGRSVNPRPSAFPSKALWLGVGPYLAVDLLDEGLAVLVLLLVLADLPELLGGEGPKSPRDLRDGQPVVVSGLQCTEDGRP